MALETTDNRKEYAGNDVTLAFSFPYYFLADADLVVIRRNDTTGVETPQVITTNYTLSGAGVEAGGTVTMLVAPPSGTTLIIYRDPEITQGKDFRENDSFPAEQAEEAWDRVTMISQRLAERAERSVKVSDGFVLGGFDLTLPTDLNASGSEGKVVVVNPTLDGFVMGPSATEIEDAAAEAAAAAASAAAAAASAVLSDASADAALASETAAAASAASAAAQLASAFFRDVVYITSADSPRTITSSDNGKLFNINSSGGAISFTLPTIASTTLPFNIAFKLTTAGNTVTINRASTDTIEGATSVTMSVAGSGLNLVADADGSPDNWSTIAVPGTILPIVNGGTGAATAAGAVNALVVAPTASKTTTYAILTTDQTVLTDASSGSFTVTLPTAAGVAGKTYIIKRTDQTLANAVTIATTSSQTIDGVTTRKLSTKYEQWTVISDGSNWQVVSHTYPKDLTQYTPTTTGFGTPSSVEVCWQRDGECVVISGNLTIGTATGSDASVSLPSGLTAAAAPKIATAGTIVGVNSTNTTDGSSNISCFFATAFPSGTAIFFGIRYVSFAPLTKQAGSGLGTGNALILGTVRIPISGWEG